MTFSVIKMRRKPPAVARAIQFISSGKSVVAASDAVTLPADEKP
jgi:hypothetical protein